MTKYWYPVINYKKCISCMECVKFCTHGVYVEKDGKPFVKNKEACVNQCRSCEKVCSNRAIIHHSNVSSKKLSSGCSCSGKNSSSVCACKGKC